MERYVVKNFKRVSDDKINKLAQFDVATVYEAQGKLGLLSDSIRPIQQGKMICGSVVTAVCYAGDNLMIHAAIEVCQANDILVVATIGESKCGMIGDLIVEALRKRKVQGLIIDAGVRDTQKIREMGFPVWSKSIYPEGTTKLKPGWVNSPAVCGGVTVNPGDVIIADDDGIVVVEQNNVEFAIHASEQRMRKEQLTIEKINNMEFSLDFYNLRSTLIDAGVVYYDNDLKSK